MRNKLVVLSFIVVFSSPYIFAQIFYMYRNNLDINTINKGSLLETKEFNVDLDVIDEFDKNYKLSDLAGKWVVLSFGNNNDLKQDMIKIKNIMYKEKDRIKFVFSEFLPSNINFIQEDVVIIDPLGNQVLKYSSNDNKTGIIKDLQRLLKYSYAG